MINDYSATWYSLLLQPIDPAQTMAEVAFIARHIPQEATILDLCCGTGRHARVLAARGYHVTGVDQNAMALAEARRTPGAEVTYIEHDMRHVAAVPGQFDAVVCLWQSFGYFDGATNQDILRQIHQKLIPGGVFILDVYHRGFFEKNQGTRSFVKEGQTVTETKTMAGNRLSVRLEYDHTPPDEFGWQLYTPEELRDVAAAYGFVGRVICGNFDEETPPSPANSRMQLVLQRER